MARVCRLLGAVLILVSVIAGCTKADEWKGCPTTGAAIAHPTGTEDVVVRVGSVGGLPLPSGMPEDPAGFTLYGDGTVITRGFDQGGSATPALPALIETNLTEEGVQALLHAAEGPCLLARSASLDIPGAFDVPAAAFEVNAGGGSHQTYVVGLGANLPGVPNLDDEGQRAALLSFADRVLHLETWLPPGAVGTPHGYRIQAVSVYATRAKGVTGTPTVSWPLSPQISALVDTIEPYGDRCGTVTGAATDRLVAVAGSTTNSTVWRSGGKTFSLRFRPVLPGERPCSF